MNKLIHEQRRAALVLAVAAAFSCATGPSRADDAHAAAVALARAGDHDEAIRRLERLSAERPGDPRVVHDLIVVRGWAGRDLDALQAAQTIDARAAPAYVLEAVGRSARNLGQLDVAEAAYRRVITRFPERVGGRIGLALVRADPARFDDAAAMLDRALALAPADVSLIEARGQVAAAAGDWVGALSHFQRSLQIEPHRVESLRGLVRATSAVGAPRLAADIAARHPGLITEPERAALIGDATALGIRWGRIDERIGDGPSRFRWLDRALADSDGWSRQLETSAQTVADDREARRLLADRVVALSLRRRAADAVALHDRMANAGIELPDHALRAVAHALLESRDPARAIPLYRELLRRSPVDFDLALGLFYALIEAERLDDATAHIDALVSSLPKWLPTGQPNPDAVTARVGQALARLYADRLDEAEQRVRALHTELPRNAAVREAVGSTFLARGRPRQADDEFRLALAVDPQSAGLRAQRVDALMAVNAFADAHELLLDAQARRPDDGQVRRATDLWAAHSMRQLTLESGFGRSGDATPAGSRDWRLLARLYSAPIDHRWRMFGQTAFAQADFDSGHARFQRQGIGAEWRDRNLRASAAATAGSTGRAGIEAAADWHPVDRWSVSLFASSVTSNLPMQAWKVGVHAGEQTASVRHAVNESRGFAVGAMRVDFSDDNERTGVWASWMERWVSRPHWRLESTTSIGTSGNTLAGRQYFNPERDRTASVEIASEWIGWREYERSFRHRLAATAGHYEQRGFRDGSILGLGYEHVWDLDRHLSLRYGIGRTLRPYDGERTGRSFGNVTLDWRF